jgi:phosphate starvation-inducible protein PhoH and related proteins
LNNIQTTQIELQPIDNTRLANLCGQFDEHIKKIEQTLAVEISNRGHTFSISGQENDIKLTQILLDTLYKETENTVLNKEKLHLFLQQSSLDESIQVLHQPNLQAESEILIHTGRGTIKPRGSNQYNYLKRVLNHDINFGIGPAGTGKTYLAVACAVQALKENKFRRLILTRPAVEAGENLGFLPGDLSQKIDPYLRPLYDALYDMLGFEKVSRLIERNVIEVAPLAFMRGRSLNESFIILDEAQNTTSAQMKMFLTRTGFGSKVIITGDLTQIDLPNNCESGLKHCLKVLNNIPGISFTHFIAKDVVRHPLVQRIVNAYDKHEQSN